MWKSFLDKVFSMRYIGNSFNRLEVGCSVNMVFLKAMGGIMKNKNYIWFITLFLCLFVTNLGAKSYSGNIKYGDGLIGTAAWNSAELFWTVEDETNPGLWTYIYTFSVERKAISYIIIGAANSFDQVNIKNGTSKGLELGQFGQNGNSTPGLTSPVYGVKWQVSGKSLECVRMIVTDREPMWGDFYAKDGKHNGDWVFAINAGFGSMPSDLTIADGNKGGWVLVPGMTEPEQKVSAFAHRSFKRIRNILAPEDETAPMVAFDGSRVEVSSAHWTYSLDSAGRQVFKPTSTYPHVKPSFSEDIGSILEEWLESPVPQVTLEEAKNIALLTLGVDYAVSAAPKVFARRELIASKSIDDEVMRHHLGRTIVLFNPPVPVDSYVKSYITNLIEGPGGLPYIIVEPISLEPRSYETSVTLSPGGRAIRVESSCQTPEVREILDIFREGILYKEIPSRYLYYDQSFRFGTFFSGGEHRFEITAYSWEGEDFLDENDPYCIPEYTDGCNPYWPFYPWEWCWNAFWAPDVDIFIRQTNSYKYWVWYWWNLFGRKNGIRGNWNHDSQSWEFDHVKVILHKDLNSYNVVYPISSTRQITTCDGIQFTVPFYEGNKMENKFYQDLERCHAAFFNTHGGPINSPRASRKIYQIKRNEDVWVPIHEEGDNGLGSGNLRHLFLETCSSMNWIYGPSKGEYKNIESDWMNHHVAAGIRTVCGHDGAGAGADRSGWRFFGHYHNGESISESWFREMLDENPCQHPVVISYGSTLDEAAETLFDGRFSKERGGTGWYVAAEWWIVNLPEGYCEDN
jgi:hypothetical protein